MPATSLERALSLPQVAEILAISETTARRLVTRGDIKSKLVGGQYRILPSTIREYMKSA